MMATIVKIKTVIKEEGGLVSTDCWLNLDTVCHVRESKAMDRYSISTTGGHHTVMTADAGPLLEALDNLARYTKVQMDDLNTSERFSTTTGR